MRYNERLIDWLKIISKEGFLEPEKLEVELSDLLNEHTRGESVEKLKEVLRVSKDHLAWLSSQVSKMDGIICEAEDKLEGAREISEIFWALSRSPLPTRGTTMHAEYFRTLKLLVNLKDHY